MESSQRLWPASCSAWVAIMPGRCEPGGDSARLGRRTPRRPVHRLLQTLGLGRTLKEMAPDISLFLCGDVMTGRGVDQVLPHPVPPHLYEQYVRDARDYVELAEARNGPLAQPVSFEYPWGDAL